MMKSKYTYTFENKDFAEALLRWWGESCALLCIGASVVDDLEKHSRNGM